jgi:hypothetical protein
VLFKKREKKKDYRDMKAQFHWKKITVNAKKSVGAPKMAVTPITIG